MFGNWFKRREPPERTPVTSGVGPLLFKDGEAALAFICQTWNARCTRIPCSPQS